MTGVQTCALPIYPEAAFRFLMAVPPFAASLLALALAARFPYGAKG